MRRRNYRPKTIGTGPQPSARMPFTFPLHTLTKGCECVEMSLRYLICAPRSRRRGVIQSGRSTNGGVGLSTLERCSKNIGAPLSMISLYRVSRGHQPVRLHLMENRSGHCGWKISLASRITILVEYYRLYLCSRSSQLTKNVRIGGCSTLVAP